MQKIKFIAALAALLGVCLFAILSAPKTKPEPAVLIDLNEVSKAVALFKVGGYLHKLDEYGNVYVKPRFAMLTYDDKQKLVIVCGTYTHGRRLTNSDVVIVYDAMTNKKLGSYSPWCGLTLE